MERTGYKIQTCETDHPVPELAYALVEDERPGKLDAEKAAKLGVKPGPLLSNLKGGNPVKLPNGRIVRPGEVVGPPRPGRKIVYTGDTRPSERMVEFARGADVLIHEATLADNLAEKAAENAHSTPSGAAEIAKRAGVKQLILVHVSPRYRDDSVLFEQATKIFSNTVVAKDLMEVEVQFFE